MSWTARYHKHVSTFEGAVALKSSPADDSSLRAESSNVADRGVERRVSCLIIIRSAVNLDLVDIRNRSVARWATDGNVSAPLLGYQREVVAFVTADLS